jgi:RNA polymerase sigma-70 factor (ECF subfamily)
MDPAAPPDSDEGSSDAIFLTSWREELLSRAWHALEEHEKASGSPYYTALRLRVDEPNLRSPDIAARLADRLGKPMSPENVRVLVHRARDRFAELLLDAVAESIEDPSPDALEEELIDLRLLEYCRDALQKRR